MAINGRTYATNTGIDTEIRGVATTQTDFRDGMEDVLVQLDVSVDEVTLTGDVTGTAALAGGGTDNHLMITTAIAPGQIEAEDLETDPAAPAPTNGMFLTYNTADHNFGWTALSSTEEGITVIGQAPDGAIVQNLVAATAYQSVTVGESNVIAANADRSTHIGTELTNNGGEGAVMVGHDNRIPNGADNAIQIGTGHTQTGAGDDNVQIGRSNELPVGGNNNIHIGQDHRTSGTGVEDNILIGRGLFSNRSNSIVMGGPLADADENVGRANEFRLTTTQQITTPSLVTNPSNTPQPRVPTISEDGSWQFVGVVGQITTSATVAGPWDSTITYYRGALVTNGTTLWTLVDQDSSDRANWRQVGLTNA